MPSPLRNTTCIECGSDFQTRGLRTRTCSPKCRAQMREREHGPTKGVPPRDYPAEIVEEVRRLYVDCGMTQDEVQQAVGNGVKITNVMRRYGIQARPAAPRKGVTAGSAHPSWKGNKAGYQAMHLRVQTVRGKPQECELCGRTDADTRYEWANLTGNYPDTNDYQRMCQSCHARYDIARRSQTGVRTSPARR